MDQCCIVGCFNRPKRGELKFYTIPTANSSRPFKVKRRKLWINAIEKANGSITNLSRDARICSAHFISGQLSLEMSDPDFVPSVFPNKLLRSREGPRNEKQRPQIASTPEASNVSAKKKAQKKPDKPEEQLHESPNMKEYEHCKPLEDEDMLEEKGEIHQPTEVEPTDLKKPVLLLKSIVGPPGWFRCDICNDHFSNSSMLVKHIRHRHQEKSDEDDLIDCEECEKSQPDLPIEEIKEEENIFKCNMCDRSFPTMHNLKRHKLLHVKDPRKCIHCGTLFCKRHNYVFQPQISTETTFEEEETVNVSNENQTSESSQSDSSESDESSSDESSDFMDTTEDQSEMDTQLKPVPAATCNPRKPKLLTAYMSFLTESPDEKMLKSRVKCFATAKRVLSTQLKSPLKEIPITKPMPEPPSQSEASPTTTNVTNTSTITTTSQPALSIPNPQQAPTNVFQKVEKSTVCLSFSKPLPSTVLKNFVTFISKNECSKSMTPRLITFQAVKPTPGTQKPPTEQPKQKLISVPMTLSSVPKLPQASSELIVKRIEPPKPIKVQPKACSVFSPPIATNLAKTPKKHASPIKEYVHSARPPSPVPIPCKKVRGPWESPLPDYAKDIVQPHLPEIPELPAALQMFSPQFLTSVMFDVKRNYDYILSNVK